MSETGSSSKGTWDPVSDDRGGTGAAPPPNATASGPVPPAPAVGTLSDYERNWAPWVHISALSGIIGIPLGHILGPLIIWLVTKDRSAFLNDQGKEALNFMLTMSIFLVGLFMIVFLSAILSVLLVPILLMFLAVAAMIVVGIVAAVYAVIGGIQASKGVWFRYPMRIQFIS